MHVEFEEQSAGLIPLPDDFAKRVLREAKRRRAQRRWQRAAGIGAALALVLVGVGRSATHPRSAIPATAMLVAHQSAAHQSPLLAANDWSGLEADLDAEEDAETEPATYFVPELQNQADDGDDAEGLITEMTGE